MDVNTISIIISLISGIIGGNLAGVGLSEKNLGAIGNTIAGLIGGGAGQFLLKLLGVLGAAGVATGAATGAPPAVDATNLANLDLSTILASIGAGGVGGGVLTAIIAYIKNAVMQK